MGFVGGRRLDGDLPVVELDEAVTDGQTQTGAHGLRGKKRLEHTFEMLRRDSISIVADLELDAFGDGPKPDRDVPPVRSRFNGIA
jgi:hypothetical protein